MRRGSGCAWGILCGALLCGTLVCACSPGGDVVPRADRQNADIEGDLLVFVAGSLTAAIAEASDRFEREHPGVAVLLESSGSQTAARKLTELGRTCDVLLSADYTVIDNLLIPDYAAWQILFARNELVLAYRTDAPRREELEGAGWIGVILDSAIDVAYCNPDTAPCGYRAMQALLLAETYYGRPGIAEAFKAKGNRHVRSQEPEVLALIETGAADYALTYRSSAEDRSLAYLRLPDELNLSDPAKKELYARVQVEILGTKPNTTTTVKGEPMVYGLTIPTQAPNPTAAVAFVAYLLDADRGGAILARNHIPLAVPLPTPTFGAIPEGLKAFATPP